MSWMDWIKGKVTGRPVAKHEPPLGESGESGESDESGESTESTMSGAERDRVHMLDEKIRALDAAIARLPDGPKKFGLAFDRGVAYKERGTARRAPADLERALVDLARVGKVLPALADVYAHRGECLVRLGKHEEALDNLERAIALLPPGSGLAAAHVLRGEAQAALGDLTAAVADFSRATEIAPELAEDIRVARARAEDAAPRTAPARRPPMYDECGALPAGWELDQRGDTVGGLVAFGKAIAREPSASAYYARGVANCKLRRFAEATADLDRALELRPRHAAALTERGLARLESGDIDGAIADYDSAIAIDPAYGTAHENRGLALLKQKRWADAVPCLDRALRIKPANASARYHRGLAHEMLDDLPRALRDLKDAVRHGEGQPCARHAEQRLSALRPRTAGIEPARPEPDCLWQVLTGISFDTTVGELAARAHAENMYFGQLQLPSGDRTFVPFYGKRGMLVRLTEIADVIGPRILSMVLRQFHDLLPGTEPAVPHRRGASASAPEDVEQLVEGTEIHVLTHGDRLLGVFTPGIAPHELDVPTALFGPQPVFARNDRADAARPCASCQRTVAYFDPVMEQDKLADYACPHCGKSPIPGWVEARMPAGSWSRAGFLGPTERLDDVIDRDARTLARLGVDPARLGATLDDLLTRAFDASAARIAQAGARFEAQLRASGARGTRGLAVLPLGATLDELEAQLGRGEPLPDDRGTAVDGHDVFLQVYVSYQYCPFTVMRRPWSDDPPPRVIVQRQRDGVRYVTEPSDRCLPCRDAQGYCHANLEFLIVRRDTRQALRGAGLLAHLIRDHRFFEGEHSPFRLDPERTARVLGLI